MKHENEIVDGRLIIAVDAGYGLLQHLSGRPFRIDRTPGAPELAR